MDELYEAVVAITFDYHLIYRQVLPSSPKLLEGNIYHFHETPDFETSVMLVFIRQAVILETDNAF